MENTNQKKDRRGLARAALLIILLAQGFWVYQQHKATYETLEISNRMTEALLDHQIALTKDYSQKLAILQASFQKTEALLTQVQEENRKLTDQLALLGDAVDLQATVSRLSEENIQIKSEIGDLKQQLAFESRNLTEVSEGRDLIKKFKNRIHNVKVRIKELNHEAYVQKVAAQKERDRMGLMLGNNGFMTREGQFTAADFNLPSQEKKEIQVNVTFVE